MTKEVLAAALHQALNLLAKHDSGFTSDEEDEYSLLLELLIQAENPAHERAMKARFSEPEASEEKS